MIEKCKKRRNGSKGQKKSLEVGDGYFKTPGSS